MVRQTTNDGWSALLNFPAGLGMLHKPVSPMTLRTGFSNLQVQPLPPTASQSPGNGSHADGGCTHVTLGMRPSSVVCTNHHRSSMACEAVRGWEAAVVRRALHLGACSDAALEHLGVQTMPLPMQSSLQSWARHSAVQPVFAARPFGRRSPGCYTEAPRARPPRRH